MYAKKEQGKREEEKKRSMKNQKYINTSYRMVRPEMQNDVTNAYGGR